MNEKLAFLFPGQGSQSIGMLAEHLAASSVVREVFDEASESLGYDMISLIKKDADNQLNHTEYTQPALLTASIALLRQWRHEGGDEAGHVGGHSLGEYSALVAAGSLTFCDAVRLVAFRGRVMEAAVPAGVGRMAAILGLDDGQIAELCKKSSFDTRQVWAANFNCPGQTVIAGHAEAVEKAMKTAPLMGAKRALPLKVSVPSHTPLMQPAAEAMREHLAKIGIKDPDRPVWSNALAAPLDKAQAIRESLVNQLVSPVRWTETIQHMRNIGVMYGVEMGPGKVLTGLIHRIVRDLEVHGTDTPELMHKSLGRTGGYDE